MIRGTSLITVLLGLLAVGANANRSRQATCETRVAHKPWGMLTAAEKTAYINAELCLMAAPSQLLVQGAQSRWDDLQWGHIVQTAFVHDVGQFLPWHRFYVVVHGRLLRDECGYNGPLPYWDETADSASSNLANSQIFQANAFGGDGTGSQRYISNGPFAATTLRLQRLGVQASSYRISRSLNARSMRSASLATLNACFQISTYTAAWECLHGSPHSSGHGGTGGLMLDVVRSPGDPVFYLHHGWLDAMWWKWQTLDLPNRLTDMGGRNRPRTSYTQSLNLPNPGPEWTNYDGDDGNITTLNHVLYAAEIYPNVTVGDIMDVRGDVVCAEYIFPANLNVTTTTIVDGSLTWVSD
ncbi:hypothetical protein S40288_01759 [Stachybotrys chartarum IBT 40288]|nr:hypothetical protein S40288_01759 [Stachybotrys chartarum IBT 40288]